MEKIKDVFEYLESDAAEEDWKEEKEEGQAVDSVSEDAWQQGEE